MLTHQNYGDLGKLVSNLIKHKNKNSKLNQLIPYHFF
jgi:hypothetical protein